MSRRRCPTCGGRGTVDWVPPRDGTWMISPWPQETCQNCGGSGWVGQPDNPSSGEPNVEVSGTIDITGVPYE